MRILAILVTALFLISAIAAAFNTAPVAATPSNLVGWWHFDDRYETIAKDETGGNDGTLMNMDPATDWVSGKFGYALDFDWTDDYVATGNEGTFDFDSDDAFTLEAWVKTSSTGILDIISKMDNEVPNIGYQFIKHGTAEDNKLFFFLINIFPSEMIRVQGSTPIADGLWHHVAVTYDGTGIASTGVKI